MASPAAIIASVRNAIALPPHKRHEKTPDSMCYVWRRTAEPGVVSD
jgi:hypothetical protein